MSESRSQERNINSSPSLEMTRRLTFSAAYSNPQQTAGSIRAVEAHNYVLDVRVRGSIDERTGIIVNIKTLDAIVREKVILQLDGYDLSCHPAFEKVAPSLSAILQFIHKQLEEELPAAISLTGIRLEERSDSWMDWAEDHAERKIKKPMFMITRAYEFSASHRLDSPHLTPEENIELFGKCNYPNGHGHNYQLEVSVEGDPDVRSGQIIDTVLLDKIVHTEVVDRYDHRHLNYDISEFQNKIPSAEIITKEIWDRLQPKLPASVKLYQVLLRETARNIFQYNGDGN